MKLFYLRHFTEPLSVLTATSLLGQANTEEAATSLAASEAKIFYLTLLARLQVLGAIGSDGEQELNGGSLNAGDMQAPVVDVNMESSEDEMLIRSSSQSPARPRQSGGNNSTSPGLSSPLSTLHKLEAVREEHKKRTRSLRIAFRLIYTIRKHLLRAGIIGSARSKSQSRKGGEEEEETVALMYACLKGRLSAKECKKLVDGVW